MNRKQRRAEGWGLLNPRLSYDDFEKQTGEDARKLMMTMVRKLIDPDAPFNDRQLWDNIRELIHAGLIKVWIRLGPNGEYWIRPEFMIGDNDDNVSGGS